MSILRGKDLRFPLNNPALLKLMGFMFVFGAWLSAVASNAGLALLEAGSGMAVQDLAIQDLYVMFDAPLAAGESLVVDIQSSTDGGATWATMLSATKTFDSTNMLVGSTKVQQSLMSLLLGTKVAIPSGTRLRAVTTYVPGGGATGKGVTFMIEAAGYLQG